MPFPHPDGDYGITVMYAVADDAWYLELHLAADHRALVTAVVPDEDPVREPSLSFNPQGLLPDIPYEVMLWFMDQVEKEIRRSRAWMLLRPELVAVIRKLRQEYLGAIDDEDFPRVLAKVSNAVPAADLPAVLASAFGRKPDGTPVGS